MQSNRKKLQRSDRWDKSLVEWAPPEQLITKVPLSHGWWVLKTRILCFHFWSPSLSFLSDWMTKTGWPDMDDGIQTKIFLWVPQILDDEWWKHNHITQNSLIQTTPNASYYFFPFLLFCHIYSSLNQNVLKMYLLKNSQLTHLWRFPHK